MTDTKPNIAPIPTIFPRIRSAQPILNARVVSRPVETLPTIANGHAINKEGMSDHEWIRIGDELDVSFHRRVVRDRLAGRAEMGAGAGKADRRHRGVGGGDCAQRRAIVHGAEGNRAGYGL